MDLRGPAPETKFYLKRGVICVVIVYKSNTGFTKEYAGMLAKAEKKKLFELSEAEGRLEENAEIFYMGPLVAGHIAGVDQAVRRYTVRAVCAVGMTPPDSPALNSLGKRNFVSGAPIFYLQGGYAPKKLSWLKRRMVNMATKSMRERLLDKGGRRTPQEQAQLDMLQKGGSFVAYRNLDAIRSWMREQP